MHRKALLSAAAGLLAVAVACGKTATAPISPSATTPSDAGAAADGSTLKVPAPGTSSPTGGTQVSDPTTLTASTVAGKYATVSLSYRFQVRSGTTVINEGVITPASGSSVSYAPTGLTSDTNYTWRVQATTQGANGPWSSDATFKSPVGAFLRNGELRDPLTIGRTVGKISGATTFTSEGISIDTQSSFVTYVMDQTVKSGEFSMMVKNIKSAAPGDKSKIMSIQQGFDDITTNAYRFTIEKRGSSYPTPGSTTYRIITGNATSRIFDGSRVTVNYDTNHWYLWTARWTLGTARVSVVDTDAGNKVVYDSQIGTGSREYEPNPMVAYIGAPVGRAGELDASVPRIIVKNVWLSAGPRPAFPQ